LDGGAEQPPTASRHFSRTDRLVIEVPWVAVAAVPEVSARLTSRDGSSLATLEVGSTEGGRVRIVVPLTHLAPGTYLVRVDAGAAGERATQQVAFTVER
jgi:hypothetical protein